MRRVVTGTSATRRVVERFVAGETLDDALAVTSALNADGLLVTLDHLGEDTRDAAQAAAITEAYVALLDRVGPGAEVSVKLTALGAALTGELALDNAATICAAAERAGTTVTVDMEDHTHVDTTLETVGNLRVEYPWVGAVVQAALRRTESDCRELGGRVRLVKGAYAEPASVAFQARSEVDDSYERCLRTLFAGEAYPMVGTHDPRFIALAGQLGTPGAFEYQMLYGVRTDEQRRLAAEGHRMRVYVPYGADWYGYFARRLAERPANLGFLVRALIGS
ncbi:proline dehydrogenase family protein [Pseudonocardia ailaonensis]|uniref:proline dehydrogenase n=1 Tax=Pseudonocardia ailaonensis TaxID=367279 RepID=A0ABN2N704_9PSEU